jgi:ribose transport system substrate-binding protein
MPQLTSTLISKDGSNWTHSIGINDLYFDYMAPSLQSAGVAGDGKPRNISAGDGSESAFQRIQSD